VCGGEGREERDLGGERRSFGGGGRGAGGGGDFVDGVLDGKVWWGGGGAGDGVLGLVLRGREGCRKEDENCGI